MPQTVLQVPTLNDKRVDFETLFALWNQTNGYFEDVRFEFSNCSFLRPNAVAFIGGLARLVEFRNGKAAFDWATLRNAWVKNTLCQNGFARAFGDSSAPWQGTSIPYREDTCPDVNGTMDYLTDNWIGKGWLHVSERLRDAIAGKMWEIYSNAFEHSGTPVGVFSCGQYFKTKNDLLLSVVDFGQGIPSKIRSFVGSDPRAQGLPPDACLRWAFTRGKSTCTGGVARGLGLDLLKEFVQVNHGKLEAYSNDGYACVDQQGEHYEKLSTAFEGTIVHITLKCDERYYRFADEPQMAWPS